MKHALSIEGHSFRLRPIEDSDAEFVVALRSDPELSRFLHATSNRVEDQLRWLHEYYQRSGDYYFVIERLRDQNREGVISIYGVDADQSTAEWGRWILRPGSLAAVESAWLIYRMGFEKLGLASMYCRTVAANQKVVSFHDSCGITQRKLVPQIVALNGSMVDVVEHKTDARSWLNIAPRLEKLVKMSARVSTHA